MSSSGNATAVKGGTGTTSTPANNVNGGSTASERRGSSSSNSGTMFSGLMNQKRGSGDASATARRDSFNDQKPAAGVIGNMWNKFTTGQSK